MTLGDYLENPDMRRRNPGLIGKVEVGVKAERGKPEEIFQQRVLDLAELNGWLRAHFRNVRIQRADGGVYWELPVAADGKGFLDLVLVRERVIWAECKVGRNQLTPEQRVWYEALKAAGQEVYIWYPKHFDEITRILARK